MALSIFHPATPPDVRRAVRALLAVAALCFAYAWLYGHLYSFRSNLGTGLPDVSTNADVLTLGLRNLALLTATWAFALVAAATPGSAAALERLWGRAANVMGRPSIAVVVAAVLAVGYALARVAVNAENLPHALADYTAGTGRTPFQYRALVPWTVRLAVAVVPPLGRSLWLPYGAAEALAAFGAWAAARRFLRPYLPDRPGERSAAAFGMFLLLGLNLALPFRHNAFFFPWDTLSVAFFTAGLALLRDRRWTAFYLLFSLATLNRETTCFLTIALVLSEVGRMPLPRLAAHGAAQLAIWVALKALLLALYSQNTPLLGAGTSSLFVMPTLLNIGAVSGVPGLLVLSGAIGGLWLVPLLLASRVAEPGLRRLFRVVPVFLAGMLVVGEVLEVRVYSELIPLVLAGLVMSIGSVVSEARRAGRSADAAPTDALAPEGKNRPVDGPELPPSAVPRLLTAARASRVARARTRLQAADSPSHRDMAPI
jgi:hypothetical protein